jgi:hypothetical protein
MGLARSVPSVAMDIRGAHVAKQPHPSFACAGQKNDNKQWAKPPVGHYVGDEGMENHDERIPATLPDEVAKLRPIEHVMNPFARLLVGSVLLGTADI